MLDLLDKRPGLIQLQQRDPPSPLVLLILTVVITGYSINPLKYIRESLLNTQRQFKKKTQSKYYDNLQLKKKWLLAFKKLK